MTSAIGSRHFRPFLPCGEGQNHEARTPIGKPVLVATCAFSRRFPAYAWYGQSIGECFNRRLIISLRN
jgi:hypothetical protein